VHEPHLVSPSAAVEVAGTTSEMIHAKQRLLGRRRWEASRRLQEHPEFAELYPSFLFRSHCVARATVPLLQAAVARLEQLRGEDPAAPGLIEVLAGLAVEEEGHDEWLLQDLEVLGVSRREVLSRMPPPTIAAMVGAQYYWLAHHHPVAVVGYVFVTETAPPVKSDLEALIARTGLPRKSFRSLLAHALLDQKHGADVERALDSLPLTEAHLEALGVSLVYSTNTFATAVEEILDLHEIRKRAGSAEGQSPIF
jgi:hypothetical protein